MHGPSREAPPHDVLALSIGVILAGAPLACASSPPSSGHGARPLDPRPPATATSPVASGSSRPPAFTIDPPLIATATSPVASGSSRPPAFTMCDSERNELWAAYRASGERACRANSECVVAVSPNSHVRELATVVHTLDSAALVARARAHLDRCGAFTHYEPNNAIRVVEAVCGQGHCAERETILHVED